MSRPGSSSGSTARSTRSISWSGSVGPAQADLLPEATERALLSRCEAVAPLPLARVLPLSRPPVPVGRRRATARPRPRPRGLRRGHDRRPHRTRSPVPAGRPPPRRSTFAATRENDSERNPCRKSRSPSPAAISGSSTAALTKSKSRRRKHLPDAVSFSFILMTPQTRCRKGLQLSLRPIIRPRQNALISGSSSRRRDRRLKGGGWSGIPARCCVWCGAAGLSPVR